VHIHLEELRYDRSVFTDRRAPCDQEKNSKGLEDKDAAMGERTRTRTVQVQISLLNKTRRFDTVYQLQSTCCATMQYDGKRTVLPIAPDAVVQVPHEYDPLSRFI
jgi:hypothetical protein